MAALVVGEFKIHKVGLIVANHLVPAPVLIRIAGRMPLSPKTAILVALSLVPPAIVLALWPGVQPMTAADVLYGRDRRD